MRQFSVCRLKKCGSGTSNRIVLQHDLRARIVAPLLSLTESDQIGRIAPEVVFEGRRYRLCLYELMTVDLAALDELPGAVDAHDLVMRGVDQIFAGI